MIPKLILNEEEKKEEQQFEKYFNENLPNLKKYNTNSFSCLAYINAGSFSSVFKGLFYLIF
jgi:hypothetical protein